jgi:protein SCO1/2
MKNKYFLFLLLSIFLFACNTNTHSSKSNKQDSITMNLPFFNKPDWTPEWININDTNYKTIHKIPAFSFKDQNGGTVNNQTVDGKIYVANFFFTTCRGICPKMTTNMSLLQAAFKNDKEILFLSHSVTPESDSITVLKQYATTNNINSDQWHLLTGPKEDIYKIAKQQYFAGDSVGFYQTGNEFLHTENFILVDKHQRIRGVYNGTLLVEIDRIKEDIAILKREKDE